MSLNQELSDLFHAFASLMELKGENTFKVIAFQKVGRILKEMNFDIRQCIEQGTLCEIEGIGKSSQQIIEEYVQTGKSSAFEDLSSSVPKGLVDLMAIEGLGPKTIHLLWQNRGITSREELEKGLSEGKLEGLKGIGEKKIDLIRKGLETLKLRAADGQSTQPRRTGIGEALEAAQALLDLVRQLPGVGQVEIAGSLRRRKETIADIDFVGTLKKSASGEEITAQFVKLPGVVQVLGQGPTKASVKIGNGMQVDLRIVPEECFGAALMYFTGSKEHNVKIRGLAQKKKMTLNEWGLYALDEFQKAEKKTAEPPKVPSPALSSDHKQLRSRFIPGVLSEFTFVISELPDGSKLRKDEMEGIEVLLLLAFPDSEPRVGMDSKRGHESSLPRFNTWDPRYGDTPESATQRARSSIAQNPTAHHILNQCIDAFSGKANIPWFKAGTKRGADIPKKQGFYAFRNLKTGRVNEGYIGIAGAGTANTLSNRLGMHFSGDKTSDNLLRRYSDEEEYLAKSALRAEVDVPLPPIASSTEEDIYQALGLTYIEPEMREDRGEIELAQQGKLPILITRADIHGDLHNHTNASDGNATIEEMAQAAKALGYEYLAITDHSKALAMTNGLSVERLLKHIENIHRISDKLKGITLLAGSEVDILADGRMDYEDEVLKELDIVIASPHLSLKQDEKKATDRLLRAIENRYVNVIGHPTGRLINRREGLPLDMPRLFKAAAENGTAMEINAGYPRLDLDEFNARAAVEAGVFLSIDTDAHSTHELDNIGFGISVARRAWVTKDKVLNCWKLPDLKKFLARKR